MWLEKPDELGSKPGNPGNSKLALGFRSMAAALALAAAAFAEPVED